ncbi:MAG: ubiquinone/menaquinone biosynthesis methyltransferase [Acidimicrobiales bacterium]
MARGTPIDLPEGQDKARAVRTMFDTIAPRYDLVNGLMTFGLDHRWRRATVAALGLGPGAVVADLACGTGGLCASAARAGLVPVGFDLSAGMLAASRASAPLVRADVASLPLPDGGVDGVTCGFALRNLVDLEVFVTEVARVVRPGGRIGILEVSEPSNPALRLGHRFYFGHVVPRIGAALSDRDAYRYLPRSVAYLPPDAALTRLLVAAGFPDARRRALSGGIVQLLTGTRG